MTKPAPALYASNPQQAFDAPRVRKLLDLARPPSLQEHGGWEWLVKDNGKLANEIRAKYPGTEPWYAVQGDGCGADPGPEWTDVGKAAVDAGVTTYVIDTETTKYPNGIVRAAVKQVRAACPTLRVLVTSFGQPLYIPNVFPPPVDSGYSNDYAHELQELCGIDSPVSGYMAQVYYSPKDNIPPTTRGVGPRSQARSRANLSVAIADGYMRPGLEQLGYQQLHGCRCDDLCFVGVQYEDLGMWALSTSDPYFDTDGENALRALCELHKRGYDGGDAIIRFQRDNPPLVVDGIMGPATLRALGILP